MYCRYLPGLLVLVLPTLSQAQDAPEDLLPAGTQIYLRWDGIEAHRASYEKTALGQMIKGETGTFLKDMQGQLEEIIRGSLTANVVTRGIPLDQVQKLQGYVKEAAFLTALLGKHGAVLGVEARGILPPQVQAMVIVPDAGAAPAPVLGTLNLVAALLKAPVRERKIGKRTIQQMTHGLVRIAWWVEGKHVVVTAGTESLEAICQRIDAGKDRLTDNPLFKKVAAFKKFETGARGFADIASLVKLASATSTPVAKLLDSLGLNGLHSVSFWWGFDGNANRTLVELDMPGPRKGLFRVLSGKPCQLTELPALPEDVTSWTMASIDSHAGLEGFSEIFDAVSAIPGSDVGNASTILDRADQALGIKLKDLLGLLGDKVVLYSSIGDSPFQGQTFLIQVKDGDKLLDGLDRAVRGLIGQGNAKVTLKKKNYQGIELRQLHVKQPGFFFTPTYAVSKGWLAIGFYPQAVRNYVLRSQGKLPWWKPDATVQAAFARMPAKFTLASVTDPRPSVKRTLGLAPLLAGVLQASSSSGEIPVDLHSLPNASEATKPLFPNVTVLSDTGRTIRWEDRSSIPMPLSVPGFDNYIPPIFGTVLFRTLF